MPSVTEVIDYMVEPELLNWMLRTGAAKRKAIQDEALRVGTVVDTLIQADLKGQEYTPNPDDKQVYNSMCAWEKAKEKYPWLKEGKAQIQKELICGEIVGHPDLIIELPDRWGVIDFKSASSIRPKYWTQVCKYLQMEASLSGRELGFVGVLRLDKTTGEPEYIEISDAEYIAYEVRVFDAYYTAYQHNFKNREMIRQQLEREVLNVS